MKTRGHYGYLRDRADYITRVVRTEERTSPGPLTVA